MKVDIEIKNPVRKSPESIDVELNHPVYGWIPFTASLRDCEPHGRAIYDAVERGDFGPVKDAD